MRSALHKYKGVEGKASLVIVKSLNARFPIVNSDLCRLIILSPVHPSSYYSRAESEVGSRSDEMIYLVPRTTLPEVSTRSRSSTSVPSIRDLGAVAIILSMHTT